MEKQYDYAIRNVQDFYHHSMQRNFYVARIAFIPGFPAWEDQTWSIGETLGM